ncbi:relaxase domain-containing protein, partial [Salmonella enterica]|uniref:relaxase domain-containing protein n=1 Tax=Salmonella enterica TaxID=28901 RepID=UPI00329748F1
MLDAIEAGNDRGLHHLEYRVLSARAKGKQVGTRGWTVASFRHLTSRALDPFPHHHNVVANTVIDEHGTRRAIDARHLYWHAQ